MIDPDVKIRRRIVGIESERPRMNPVEHRRIPLLLVLMDCAQKGTVAADDKDRCRRVFIQYVAFLIQAAFQFYFN